MGSLGSEAARNKAMWLRPKLMGASPAGRWGHSACYFNGFVYVFGGCCGGTHFSDVLVLSLETMSWNILVTRGQGPGPRDSHTAVVVGYKMVVFGGTNGSKKVNDVHILDLRSNEWTVPECEGVPPSPRESHTSTLYNDDKLVVFGGSGEGEANYLNDLHVLDLKSMKWTAPEVRGVSPVPRDSHTAVAVGHQLFVYGGDSGDRYQGDVDVLDMDALTWSKMEIQGTVPGGRAGHASVNFGSKVYVIGGVGDKQYYNDVWFLDIATCSWTQLDILGQNAQGRFSHTATVINSKIAIYGGCGEDEHPLNELLMLQIGGEHTRQLPLSSGHRFVRTQCGLAKKRLKAGCMRISENLAPKMDQEPKSVLVTSSDVDADILHLKRRRGGNSVQHGVQSDVEDTSLSLSQNSSPSQSDQERPAKKATDSVRAGLVFSPTIKETSSHLHTFTPSLNQAKPTPIFVESSNLPRSNGHLPNGYEDGVEELKHHNAGRPKELMGAEVRGEVDGAFDSGFLISATVNGVNFRGVLFAPGPNRVPRGVNHSQKISSSIDHPNAYHANPCINHYNPAGLRPSGLHTKSQVEESRALHVRRSSSGIRSSTTIDSNLKQRSELQGVDLTLAVPGDGNVGSNIM